MSKLLYAEGVAVWCCNGCGHPHIDLLDSKGEKFATAVLSDEAIGMILIAQAKAAHEQGGPLHSGGETGLH